MSGVNLALDDVVELTELLQFIDHRLAGDQDHLNASLHRFIGHPAYNVTRLRADLAHFNFLLGGDTDGELFQPPPTHTT
jgi:hypothetical protein